MARTKTVQEVIEHQQAPASVMERPHGRFYDDIEVVTLPDGLKVPREMINDLKLMWPRDPKTNRWIAPCYEDQRHIPNGEHICPNCKGPEGDGKLYAPTGGKRKHGAVWFAGDKLDRELKAYDCPICSTGNIRRTLIMQSGMAEEWDAFDTAIAPVAERNLMVQTLTSALNAWLDARSPFGWINVIGSVGSGKSWFSKLLVYRLIEKGLRAHYTLASDLSKLPYQALDARKHDENAKGPDDVLTPYYEIPWLAVDEIFLEQQRSGGGGERSFGLQRVSRLLDHRYTHRHRLATIMVWDIDWWTIRQGTDGHDEVFPNIALAGDLGFILSRSTEAEWMAWTKCPDLRPRFGNRKRRDVIDMESL